MMEPIAWLFLTGFTALRERVIFVPWFSATEALSEEGGRSPVPRSTQKWRLDCKYYMLL